MPSPDDQPRQREPADGYTLTVRSAGPTFVSVHFIAGRDDVAVHATSKNGQPVGVVDE